MDKQTAYEIVGKDCGKDADGVFHCKCGKCRALSEKPHDKQPQKDPTQVRGVKEVKGMVSLKVQVDSKSLDEAIEKTNRLVELLQEATQIIDSLSHGKSEKVDAEDFADGVARGINRKRKSRGIEF